MKNEVYIEEALLEVFNETDLTKFQAKLCVDLQLSRLEHFDHVTDDELHLAGLSIPSIRRLRLAITDKKKKLKKSKGIFSTAGKKDGLNMTKVLLATDVIPDALPTTSKGPPSTPTCLIAKEEIFLAERLGEGSFAVVKRALWKRSDGIKIDVAVKILREPSTEIMEDLQQEVNNMQRLQHPNLIRLYGIVFSNPAMMVVEFCDGGALIDRLRAADKPVLLLLTLLDYSLQIAKGMTYLESKHCVHRDLAARNVLLTDGDRVAKICDFGLMRALNENERLYTMSAQKKIPFAWCPPESLRYRQFSRASDVWAFGVTLWELFSYGEEPWAGCRGAEVLSKLEAGERLQRPKRCSMELYELMSTCWSSNADVRPKFSLLKGLLADTKFTIVECRENFSPEGNLDLELKTNDRIVVIEGSGVIWFGQNIRTRKFGHFQRSAIHLRNERNNVSCPTVASTGDQSLVKREVSAGGNEKISKPIPGSFIHAGHGDIVPSQCWGQPESIDEIYLKNPILRKDWEMKNDEPKRPKFIPSVVSMQTSRSSSGLSTCARTYSGNEHRMAPSRPKLPNVSVTKKPADTRSIYSTSSVDPFAPFSEYYYDAFDENDFDNSWSFTQQTVANSQSQQTTSSLPPPVAYDAPPVETARIYQPSAVGESIYGHVEGSPAEQFKDAAAVRNELCNSNEVISPSVNAKYQSISKKNSTISTSKPSSAASTTATQNLVSDKAKKPGSSGHPYRLPPPTTSLRPLQVNGDENCKKSVRAAVPRPLHTLPDQQTGVRVADGSMAPQHSSVNCGILSSTSNKQTTPKLAPKTPLVEGFSRTSVPLTYKGESEKSERLTLHSKGSSASLNGVRDVSTLTKSKIPEVNIKTTPAFNASKYYAASSREVHGSGVEKGGKGSQTFRREDDTLKETVVKSVLSPSNNTTTAFRETTFAVNISPSSTGSENKDLVQKSAAVSAKVNLATKSGLNTCNMSSSTITNSVADGSDPFEISSSVKNIASRGRYSEVFTMVEGTSSSLQNGQKSAMTPVPVVTTKLLNSSTMGPSGSSSLLPPPSPLLLGGKKQQHTAPSSGLALSTSSSLLPTGNKTLTAISTNGSATPASTSQPTASNGIIRTSGDLQSQLSASSVSGTPYRYSPLTANIFGQEFRNQMIYGASQPGVMYKNPTQLLSTSSPYNPIGYNSVSSMVQPQTFVTPGFNPPYYWHPGQTSFSSVLTPEVSSCSLDTRNRTALVYDANVSNSPRRSQNSQGFKSLLTDDRNNKNIGISGCNNPSSTLVTDEILGLFDPLTASLSNNTSVSRNVESQGSSSGNKRSEKQVADPVEAVLKDAVFAGRDKCQLMLRKCGNDVEKAVRELKTEELLAMGLTRNRTTAILTLEDCNWDLNAAASALIT